MIQFLLLLSVTSFAHDHRYRKPLDKAVKVKSIESRIGHSYDCGKIRLSILSEHIVSTKKTGEIDTEYYQFKSSNLDGNLYKGFLQGHQKRTSTLRIKNKLNLKLILESDVLSIVLKEKKIECNSLKP